MFSDAILRGAKSMYPQKSQPLKDQYLVNILINYGPYLYSHSNAVKYTYESHNYCKFDAG